MSELAIADLDRQMVDETKLQRTISLSISERRDIHFHSQSLFYSKVSDLYSEV